MVARLVIGTKKGVAKLVPTDAGLDSLEATLGAGSELFVAARDMLVACIVDPIFHQPMARWREIALAFTKEQPGLGWHVLDAVDERMTRIVFLDLGDWLEERWPWLFAEVHDQDDACAEVG